MSSYVGKVTEPRASDPDALPTPLRSAAGAVFGIAAALLLSLLGGGVHASRLHGQAGIAAADQYLATASDRASDARRAVAPKGPNARRPDLDTGLPPTLNGFALSVRAPEATPYPAIASTPVPPSWPSTTRARAPPLA